VGDDDLDSAVLCLSELVTNAVIHTRSGCEVRLVLDGGLVTGTVRDLGGALRPPGDGRSRDPLRVHGRGLQLVDALATRWSSEPDADGTTVWFALETSAPAGPPGDGSG
jgi:anti-sigma regulatory factor (Ser/Thr protein kinase)